MIVARTTPLVPLSRQFMTSLPMGAFEYRADSLESRSRILKRSSQTATRTTRRPPDELSRVDQRLEALLPGDNTEPPNLTQMQPLQNASCASNFATRRAQLMSHTQQRSISQQSRNDPAPVLVQPHLTKESVRSVPRRQLARRTSHRLSDAIVHKDLPAPLSYG